MNPSHDAGASAQIGVEESLRAIGTLFQPGDVIELRALHVGRTPDLAGRTHAGYFNFESGEQLRRAIRSVDGKAEGVYAVLNPCSPALLARSANRLQVGLRNTTSDADILDWRWLYIDADANRPAGISATEAEHEAALQRINQIRSFLLEQGWPEPVQGDSGNGGHLLYRLPSMDPGTAGDLVKRCLRALAQRFSDSVVKVDEATGNAARLCKLYGTMARKGDSTPDRPHRRSSLIETPETIIPVSMDDLRALASEVAAPTAPATNRTISRVGAFDIDQWLQLSGLTVVTGPQEFNGGRKWILDVCPFNPVHAKPAVISLSGGALVYKCLHKSCTPNNWNALRQLVDPGYLKGSDAHVPGPRRGENQTVDASIEPPLITDLAQIPSVFSLESKLDWRVDSMIAEGSITLICAESGTGKTWLGYFLAGCIAHGAPILGHSVRNCPVLYLDGENPLYVAKQRFSDLGIADSPALKIWGGWNLSPPVGPDDPLVIEFAREQKGLIVYDSLIEFHTGSEQSSTETRAFMRLFRALANLGATVVILHHTGKAEGSKQYRGSSDIKAAVDTAYLLTKDGSETTELGKLSMSCFKARLAPPRNFGMEFKKELGFVSCEAFRPALTVTEIIAEVLAANPGSNQSQVTQIAVHLGLTKRQIENSLKSGPWVRIPGPKNSTLYSLGAEK
jgi:AAA domain